MFEVDLSARKDAMIECHDVVWQPADTRFSVLGYASRLSKKLGDGL